VRNLSQLTAKQASQKLSQMQKEILLEIHTKTSLKDSWIETFWAEWHPSKWFWEKKYTNFETKWTPSHRANFANSLKRLKLRGLIDTSPLQKDKRTQQVRLTKLGKEVVDYLKKEG
jgi:hypothetical protein